MVKFYLIAILILAGAVRSSCQSALPEVFEQGTIPEQFKYLDEHTRIYENYRAIREDMFRVVSRNTLDTLSRAKKRIHQLVLRTTALNNRIDSLNNSLNVSNVELTEAIRTKDSIRVLRMEVNKITYNSIMWTVLAVLVFLLISGYLSFRHHRAVTLRTKKDLEELKEEFEAYRQKVRIEREKTNLEHFNEIKKLKGGGAGRG